MPTEKLLGLALPLVYALLIAIESRYAARAYVGVAGWRWRGLQFFAMVMALGSLFPLLLPLPWLARHALLDLSDLGLWGIPIGLLTSTFLGYWLHRAEHHLDWLWRASHQLHHSALRIDVAGAFFTHPVEVLLKVLLANFVSVCLLGLTPLAAGAVGVIGAGLSLWQHFNIRTPHGLGYVVPRPESHALHHEYGVHARNYGDLPIWDMLFGTFVNPRAARLHAVGFPLPASGRIKDMLMMRDVNK